MEIKVERKCQDLKHLKWEKISQTSGTVGSFLKCKKTINGILYYYKLSDYVQEIGIVGHECVNELIVSRLLELLNVDHVNYQLIYAEIEHLNKTYKTYLCVSENFKKDYESKCSFEAFFQQNSKVNESIYDFCIRQGWKSFIDKMMVVDYLILNRDRHSANFEILKNTKTGKIYPAPLFDHGVSLLCRSFTHDDLEKYNVAEDKRCQTILGTYSTFDNLSKIQNKKNVFDNRLRKEHKNILLKDLDGILPGQHLDKIWEMIWTRWSNYENLCNM